MTIKSEATPTEIQDGSHDVSSAKPSVKFNYSTDAESVNYSVSLPALGSAKMTDFNFVQPPYASAIEFSRTKALEYKSSATSSDPDFVTASHEASATATDKISVTSHEEVSATASDKISATASDKTPFTAPNQIAATAPDQISATASDKTSATASDDTFVTLANSRFLIRRSEKSDLVEAIKIGAVMKRAKNAAPEFGAEEEGDAVRNDRKEADWKFNDSGSRTSELYALMEKSILSLTAVLRKDDNEETVVGILFLYETPDPNLASSFEAGFPSVFRKHLHHLCINVTPLECAYFRFVVVVDAPTLSSMLRHVFESMPHLEAVFRVVPADAAADPFGGAATDASADADPDVPDAAVDPDPWRLFVRLKSDAVFSERHRFDEEFGTASSTHTPSCEWAASSTWTSERPPVFAAFRRRWDPKLRVAPSRKMPVDAIRSIVDDSTDNFLTTNYGEHYLYDLIHLTGPETACFTASVPDDPDHPVGFICVSRAVDIGVTQSNFRSRHLNFLARLPAGQRAECEETQRAETNRADISKLGRQLEDGQKGEWFRGSGVDAMRASDTRYKYNPRLRASDSDITLGSIFSFDDGGYPSNFHLALYDSADERESLLNIKDGLFLEKEALFCPRTVDAALLSTHSRPDDPLDSSSVESFIWEEARVSEPCVAAPGGGGGGGVPAGTLTLGANTGAASPAASGRRRPHGIGAGAVAMEKLHEYDVEEDELEKSPAPPQDSSDHSVESFVQKSESGIIIDFSDYPTASKRSSVDSTSIGSCNMNLDRNIDCNNNNRSSRHRHLSRASANVSSELPNVIVVRALAMRSSHAHHSSDLLAHAFLAFPDRDFVALTKPRNSDRPEVLRHFHKVTPTGESSLGHELFICHRAALLKDFKVSPLTSPEQLTSLRDYVKSFTGNLDLQGMLTDFLDVVNFTADRRWTESRPQRFVSTTRFSASGDFASSDLGFTESTNHRASKSAAFLATVAGKVVGVALLSDVDDLPTLTSNFDVEAKLRLDAYDAADFGRLRHFVLAAPFVARDRAFLREIMRRAGKSCLFYDVFADWDRRRRRTSLVTCVGSFTPVRARRLAFFPERMEERRPREARGHDAAFGLFLADKRRLHAKRRVVDRRIVVVGASTTGLACLHEMMLSERARMENLVLVSPRGFGDDVGEEHVINAMQINRQFSRKELAQMALRFGVKVVSSRLQRLDPRKKVIYVSDNERVSYDTLVIATGLQRQMPETTADSGDPPANGFLMNDVAETRRALDAALGMEKPNRKCVVFGEALRVCACAATLMEKGMKAGRIVAVTETEEEEEEREGEEGEVHNPLLETLLSFILSWMEEEGVRVLRRQRVLNMRFEKTANTMFVGAKEISQKALSDREASGGSNRSSHDAGPKALVKIGFHPSREVVKEVGVFLRYSSCAIDRDLGAALNGAAHDAVLDGGVVIDANFTTTLKDVFAGGSVATYQRRYYAEGWRQRRYNSEEVGRKLARRVLRRVVAREDGEEGDPEEEEEEKEEEEDVTASSSSHSRRRFTEVPLFRRPIVTRCRLPNRIRLLHVRRPNEAEACRFEDALAGVSGAGREFRTGSCRALATRRPQRTAGGESGPRRGRNCRCKVCRNDEEERGRGGGDCGGGGCGCGGGGAREGPPFCFFWVLDHNT